MVTKRGFLGFLGALPFVGKALASAALDPALEQIPSTTYYTCSVPQSIFYVGVNQKASYRWVAAPGSDVIKLLPGRKRKAFPKL